MSSFIDRGVTIAGDLSFTGEVQVEGEIRGDVRCVSLILGERALIAGAVIAEHVVVRGRVTGPITGQSITLAASARVDGDIRHTVLLIEKGALFRGRSRPSDDASENDSEIRPSRSPRDAGNGRARAGGNGRPAGPPPAIPAQRPVRIAAAGLLARTALRVRLQAGRGPSGPPGFLVPAPSPAAVRRWRLRLASPALNLLTLLSGGALLAGYCWLPPPAERYPLARTLDAPTARELVLLDARGKPFARRGGCFDEPVVIAEVPGYLIDALLAMEDRRFYRHFGIDPVGVLRAALFNYSAGRVVQGGSTITQQLAKISYLSGAKTLERKLEEALIVLRLELGLSKNQILERYLSRAYFGEGCFGLRAAARHYFARPVAGLSLAQSAYLVALLRSPAYFAQNREELRRRERLVLRAMAESGRLTEAELAATRPAARPAAAARPPGAYFADWAAETAKLPQDGAMNALTVRTSFEPELQRIAERAMETVLRKAGRYRRAGQAALVAMRPDGRVVAMVGGVDYEESQFNRATQALRQPGSSFKAFVYLAAMRAGARTDMLVVDEPITIDDWSPENYDRRYHGAVSLQTAFSASINTVAVRLSEAVGRAEVVKAARDLGITTRIVADPSLALGTSEVTLLELTSAYAAFAANAYPVRPWGVVSLGAAAGEGRPPRGAGRWRLMVGDRMRTFLAATVANGTARGARLPIPSYGKTGTSQNYRDAWFIGFAGNLIVGVWVGNDDNSPMQGVTGGNLPTLIWRRFMSEARRRDRHFSPRLPERIAAFRAEAADGSNAGADPGRLEALLLRSDRQFAAETGSRGDYGGAMMFGAAQERTEQRRIYRRRYRRSRPIGSWVNNQDGS